MVYISGLSHAKQPVHVYSFGDIVEMSYINNSKFHKYDPQEDYKMDSDSRGLCVIVNNFFTIGTFKETQRLQNIFRQLKFGVIMKKNLCMEKLVSLMCNISKKEETSKYDAFLFYLIARGNQNGAVYGFDDLPLPIDEIINFYFDGNCPMLEGKPRIFLINCCESLLLGFVFIRNEIKNFYYF